MEERDTRTDRRKERQTDLIDERGEGRNKDRRINTVRKED